MVVDAGAAEAHKHRMRSPPGFAGSLALLLGAPAAIAVGAIGGSAEVAIHVALGVCFVLLALATFDFRLPTLITWIACAAIGLLGAIFLLQAVSDGVQSPELRTLAFDILGQRLEKALGYAFLLWCVAVVAVDSHGWRRALGVIALTAAFCAEGYAIFVASTGAAPMEALKLVYLGVFVWLLLESSRRTG